MAFARRHLLSRDGVIVLALVALALAVRLPQLAVVPPNITADEADNFQSALRVLLNKGPGLFGLDWKPAPAFSIHLMAWSMRVFGTTIDGMRMPSVLLSALTIVPFYFLARQHTRRAAAISAGLLLSTSLWFLTFSRSGWENVHIAFYAAMAAWMLSLALRSSQSAVVRNLYFAAVGLFAALGLYGYFAGRLILASLLLFLPLALWQHRDRWQQILAGYAVLVAVCIALFAPQLPVIVHDWQTFNRRVEGVSVLSTSRPYNGETTTSGILREQIGTTLREFLVMDSTVPNNGRYFPVQRPLFDWLTAVLFTGGLAIGLACFKRLGLWWCLLLVPLVATQVFSTNAPDLARAIGSAPFFYLFVALALETLLRRRNAMLGVVQLAVLVAVPVASFANFSGYLQWMATSQAAQAREPAVQVDDFGQWLNMETTEIEAGRRGLNVTEWQRLRPKQAITPSPAVPAAASSRRRVIPAQEQPPVDARLTAQYGLTAGTGNPLAPRGVTVGTNGDIYVADAAGRRVAHFAADGQLLPDLLADFAEPVDVALSDPGTLYVLDSERGVVTKLSPLGETLGRIGAGQGMYHPRAISLDRAGLIYIADTGRDRVLVLADDGRTARTIDGKDYFQQPTGVAVDATGNVYVADPSGRRLVKLDPAGNYILEWSIAQSNTAYGPHLALLPSGPLLVSDPTGAQILMFGPEGQPLGLWGNGDGEGKARQPVGIAVSKAGGVYVADAAGGTIKQFELPR